MGKASKSQLTIMKEPDESTAHSLSRVSLSPAVLSAVTLRDYALPGIDELPLDSVVAVLDAQNEAANAGDFSRAESMLASQAHTLDAIFNKLARQSANAEYMKNMEAYLKLALKAQSQCRCTVEALAEIKSPKSVAFVRQANFAHGHQQVNNNQVAPARARKKRKTAKQTNQVGRDAKQTLDTTGKATPSRANPAMATVDASHRP